MLLLVLLGLIYRLDFLFASAFSIDADEAIVGLMARHILEGRGVPVFYYGQHYMGSFEALCAAAVFWLFGSSSAALKAVPLAFSLALIVLVYRLGRELGSRRGAFLAALFAALPPAALLEWGTRARGGFIELVVIGGWALLCTLRALKEERLRSSSLIMISFLLGVGWWVNNQVIYFILPVKFALLARIIRDHRAPVFTLARAWLCGLAGFAGGSLPFWIYNLQRDFVSFDMFRASGADGFLDHLGGMIGQALPILLGARRFWQTEDVFPYATLAVFFVYLLLLLVLISVRRRQCLELFVLRVERGSAAEVFLVFLAATSLVFAASSFGYLVQAPRYLLPAYLGVFVLAGYALDVLMLRSRAAGFSLCAAIVLFNLMSFYLGGRAVPGEPFVFEGQRVSRNHAELIGWLAEHNYPWVKTNYWIGYRLAFETKENVRFEMFHEPHQERISSYVREAGAFSGDKPYVLVPAQAALVERALAALGMRYQRARVSGYVIIYGIAPIEEDLAEVDDVEHRIVATYSPQLAGLALDGNLESRWASAHPQVSGMEFSVSFGTAQILRGFEYDLGEWAHDFPRALSIDFELASGEMHTLLKSEDYQAVRYFTQYEGKVRFVFPPTGVKKVVLRQTGSHPVFDWSIAELRFFR